MLRNNKYLFFSKVCFIFSHVYVYAHGWACGNECAGASGKPKGTLEHLGLRLQGAQDHLRGILGPELKSLATAVCS